MASNRILPLLLLNYHSFTLQGLCLVDWGRGIDLGLFPDGTKFIGDCRTSGFHCIEMQEKKPWTFQASLPEYIPI